ncbi:MAG: hypothetical protein MUP55_00555 [Candidatus Aenigmarchaeota archaeon]|nr:hypothetical protein [Candidatus Aenigmarchaeota archaeon]
MYKDDCKFRRWVKVCTFKEDDCAPEKCDMYNVAFDRQSVKAQIALIEAQISGLTERNLNKDALIRVLELEKQNAQHPEVTGYKKILKRVEDLEQGKRYMNKALIFIKRIGR